MESTQSSIAGFGAECPALKSGLGGLPWPSGAVGGELRRQRPFPGDVLPCGGLAGAGRDARLCETKRSLLVSRKEKDRLCAATGAQRGSGFGCAVLAAAEKHPKGDSNGHGDDA